ncbi:acyl-CoA dehydrogenase/oxidase [Phakopsora pachyrhizi]|uniref:Acyl-CoA dehydrogenase/oxidase n=1 Tax=Phakopsora pachyrhizi TaxID=170000 RepID=A0AAV0BDT2_PHAPC|nr:acyl-CoA dehydrogenase/oxidase [Phakopsora pachyrhizi]
MSSESSFETVFDTVPAGKQLKKLSRQEVSKHSKEGDLWCIIDTAVYDLSKFLDLHPGGAAVLLEKQVAGKDATEAFFGLHRSEVLKKYGRLVIGQIEGEEPKLMLPKDGELSLVPHAEPAWISQGYYSPYYNESHKEFQKAMRLFFDKHVTPQAREHEQNGKRVTQELVELMAKENINATRLGPGKHLHGLNLLGGLKGENFDYFHELILTQELARTGARGFSDGFLGGLVIGLPPVLNFGSPELKKKVIPEVLSGKKYIALAISEAFAGSDVAGLRCTATKTPDGKHYIVNGTKKWITNGTFADYFSTGVRTDKGLSVLLIERGEGVETKPIKTSYSPAAGTAYVTFDNVKVPVTNLLGAENKGLLVILSNFNHERWIMCCGVIRSSRFITEECFKWAHQRKAFGKPLIALPVIRQKFAQMFSKCEATQSWLENVTYQMNKMSYMEQADLLAGQIGLLKAFSTRVAHEIADDAVQIFGGRGITATGMGKFVEMFQRSYKFDAVLGGSEEVLFDLGVRQAMRKMPPAVL